ncbi:MAG: hypothetical protein DMF93_01630 [Acidobacteria bacterium]|nr:MAG: hypothetical protein DMF93_01630 [Acidobacteriota bacterium]
MNAREHWQALQSHLTSTRAALDRGDRTAALAEVNAALALDPDFLAAHSLRERILAGELLVAAPRPDVPIEPPAAIPPVAVDPPAVEMPLAAAPIVDRLPGEKPLVSTEGYAKFEQRAKRRRVDRRIEAARLAIDRKKLKQAAAALDEVIELDPNLPELVELTAQFDQLRRSMMAIRRGPWIAATAVFAGTVFGASWLQDSSPLFSRPMIATAPLLAAPTVAVSDELLAAAGTMGTLPAPTDVKAPARKPEPAALAPEPMPVMQPIAIPRPPIEAAAAEPFRPPAGVTLPPPPPSIVPAPRPVQESTVGEVLAAPIAPRPIAAVVPPKAETVDDRLLVQQTLQRYRSAYEGLDAQSAHAVWPAVNQVALARAFNGLESQSLTFEACDVRVRGEAATATCQGTARYVPKVGSREPRTEPRVWNFTLRKSGNDWKIDSARAER